MRTRTVLSLTTILPLCPVNSSRLLCRAESPHGHNVVSSSRCSPASQRKGSFLPTLCVHYFCPAMTLIPVGVIMTNVPHRFKCLTTWSSVDGAVWDNYRTFRSWVLAVGSMSCHWGTVRWALAFYSLAPLPLFLLCFLVLGNMWLAGFWFFPPWLHCHAGLLGC